MNSGSVLGNGDHQSRSFDKIAWQFLLQTTVKEKTNCQWDSGIAQKSVWQ
jgi:hypothetical protein